jgi:hypothetical protein
MGRWCKANEQQACGRIAETRHRTAPIDLVAIRTPLLPRHLTAVRAEARAAFAFDDRMMNISKTRTGSRGCAATDEAGRYGFQRERSGDYNKELSHVLTTVSMLTYTGSQ